MPQDKHRLPLPAKIRDVAADEAHARLFGRGAKQSRDGEPEMGTADERAWARRPKADTYRRDIALPALKGLDSALRAEEEIRPIDYDQELNRPSGVGPGTRNDRRVYTEPLSWLNILGQLLDGRVPTDVKPVQPSPATRRDIYLPTEVPMRGLQSAIKR